MEQREPAAIAPATLEGWYALHTALELDWERLRALEAPAREELARGARSLFGAWRDSGESGWSAPFRLVAGGADLLFVHFRPTLDALAEAELELKRSGLGPFLTSRYEFLSVTEAGLYYATAEAAAEGAPGSREFERAIAEKAAAEAASPHVHTRLYPQVPEGMRYVSFYPMSKRREGGDNWYVLPIERRSELMREHGLTGRRYAGKVFQVITGAVGFDDWEWGVTLFARDPLEFKRIVTEMRYDEASARYGEFGRFFTGIRLEPADWDALLQG